MYKRMKQAAAAALILLLMLVTAACGGTSGSAQSGAGQAAGAQSGSAQSGAGQSEGAQAGNFQSGAGQSEGAQAGNFQSGAGQSEGSQTESVKSSADQAANTDQAAANVQSAGIDQAAAAAKAAAQAMTAEEIYKAAADSVGLKGVVLMPPQYVYNYYGIDMEQYPDSFFAMSEDAVSAETIVFIRTGSREEAETLGQALETVVEQKSDEMRNYLPAQYDLVAGSEVTVRDNAVYLIISEHEKEIRKIIESGL